MTGQEEQAIENFEKIEWSEYRIGDLFIIENTSSFNTDRLVDGIEYDYVTRTSFNQGILRSTGFLNSESLNPKNTWSLGLLQMDFFYRQKPWYAGQFVRKITPKIKIEGRAIIFFTTLLNMQKQTLLNVLVRNVDKTFLGSKIKLPTKNNNIDFEFMEILISAIQKLVIKDVVLFADRKIKLTKELINKN